MVIADYYYPDWGGVPFLYFFWNPGWKIPSMAGDGTPNFRS